MRKSMLAAMAAVMVVAGCGTRLNPVNWFGSSGTVPVAEAKPDARAGWAGRTQIAQITELHIERTRDGAIVRAKGIPHTQGWYKAELLPQPGMQDGELVLDFLVHEPPGANAVGTPVSREITAAFFLTKPQLEEVRNITVRAEGNARNLRR